MRKNANELEDDYVIPLKTISHKSKSLAADEQNTSETEDDVQQSDRREAGFDRGDTYRRRPCLPNLFFTGGVITFVTILVLIGAGIGLYRFSGGAFFTDFVSAWLLPLVLQLPAAVVVKYVPAEARAWIITIMAYCILCMVLVAFEVSSSIYVGVTQFGASYAGSNNLYVVGILIAIVVTIGLFVMEIFHLIVIIDLLPMETRQSRDKRRNAERH